MGVLDPERELVEIGRGFFSLHLRLALSPPPFNLNGLILVWPCCHSDILFWSGLRMRIMEKFSRTENDQPIPVF